MSSRPACLSYSSLLSTRFLSKRWATMCVYLVATIVLSGCAAQFAYRDGKDLIGRGKVEEGLAKFQEAVELDPRGVEYRLAYISTRDRIINNYLEQGDRLAVSGKWTDAEKMYQRALALDTMNDRAQAGLRTIEAEQRHAKNLTQARAAWNKKDTESAQFNLNNILIENPKHADALALKKTIAESTVRPPVESILAVVYRKPLNIEFKDVTLKQIFEVISRTSGLNFLFDKDVKTDQKTSIFLKNSTIASAVHYTLLTNQLDQQVLDDNTILIYPNTAGKQKDYQEMVVKTFLLANADAKAVANSLKTLVKSKDIVVDDKLNMVMMRDSPEVIRLAEKIVAVQDVPEPEVMLEVEILEVKRSRLQELGIKWPDTLVLTPLPSTSGGTLTLRDLQNLNTSTVGAGISPMTISARQQDSDANILANPRIRARNHEKAKILIGERVPNITSTATATGFVSESINYVDVGLKLDVEPTVYLDNDVAIKVSLEVSNIVSQIQTKSGSIAYQIGTRTASTVLRLKDGENQVLAGLINDEDRRSAGKVPGLGELPVVGRLFGSTSDNNQKTEIVLSITPRLIRNIQRPDAMLSEFRAGTETSFRTRPDSGSVTPTTTPNTALPKVQTQTHPATTGNQAINSAVSASTDTVHAVDGVANTPEAAALTTLLRWQGPMQARIGEAFGLQLVMQADQPVTSLPMAISFDNKVLQVVSVVEGDFLKQSGGRTNFTSRVDPNGQILMTGTRSGEGGATAAGIVATINFRPLKPADGSRIQLLTVAPIGLAGRSVVVPIPAPYQIRLAQ